MLLGNRVETRAAMSLKMMGLGSSYTQIDTKMRLDMRDQSLIASRMQWRDREAERVARAGESHRSS